MHSESCDRCGQNSAEVSDGICPDCQSLEQQTIPPTSGATADQTIAPSSSFGAVGDHQVGSPKDFGEYELIEEIARGGMGVVYKARHRKPNRIAAVKMILNGQFSSTEELQRFHVEAEAAARLDHPGIVPVYEIGECDNQAFFAMKFIEGGALSDKIERFKENPRLAVELLTQVANAVHHAHQRGILHRDLKPANILLDEHERPLVTDLGLAKSTTGGSDLTHTGAVLGTPSYMAPEQASGGVVTTAADVYSLGAIMYELLSGSPPYKGNSSLEVIMQVLNSSPEPLRKKQPGIDRDLELICSKCLERDPEKRYSSAKALVSDLERWSNGQNISINPPSLTAMVGRWFRQNQGLTYGGFALLMGVLICLPIALAFFADDQRDIYDKFPDDQRPLLFSVIAVPQWISVASACILFFVLWPSIGFINAAITQPRSIIDSIRRGLITAVVLGLIFFVMLGWMLFGQSASNFTKSDVRTLANAVWTPEGMSQELARAKANRLFGGVQHISEPTRADTVTRRISADQLASAPFALMLLFIIGTVFGVPVVYGTILGSVLIRRKTKKWLCILRYAIAWWAISVATIIPTVVSIPIIAGEEIPFGLLIALSVVVSVMIGIAYLCLRRWKRKGLQSLAKPSSAPA